MTNGTPPPPRARRLTLTLTGRAGARGGSREGGGLRRPGWKPRRAPARRERPASHRAARVDRRPRGRPGGGRVSRRRDAPLPGDARAPLPSPIRTLACHL